MTIICLYLQKSYLNSLKENLETKLAKGKSYNTKILIKYICLNSKIKTLLYLSFILIDND